MIFSKSRPVKIVLVGTGGTGGYIVPQLYRLLYALDRPIRVILCDGDLVEEKNLGRQNFIEADLGKNKAMVLAERYKPIRRSSLADAFRSATGDIYHRLVVKDAGVPQIINVYCRDNRGPKGIISRELVKETLHEDTNEYKKLANISLDRGSGVFSYDNLEADPNVDALSCCQDAQELFALYQTCASRRQIDTLLQNYLDTMQAVKAARGRIYFIPRDYMPKLALFEDFIALLEQHNQHKYADRLPLDANSMFVVDDEKQRSKMALAFYRTIQKDLAEYEKRATHLIQSGNQSPAIMDRMVLSIRELERKKIYYESILKQELHEVDEQYTSLRYLSDELQIRARSIQAQKRLAA